MILFTQLRHAQKEDVKILKQISILLFQHLEHKFEKSKKKKKKEKERSHHFFISIDLKACLCKHAFIFD